MDNLNKKACEVLKKEGEKKFIEHVFTHPDDHNKPKEEKRQLSYAEMRMLYGWFLLTPIVQGKATIKSIVWATATC